MSSWTSTRSAKKRIMPLQPAITQIENKTPLNCSKDTLCLENSSERINTFHSNSDAIITFIIPTIGRHTLINSIKSIENQTIKNWKAIIIFDGYFPTDTNLLISLNNDNRFLPIYIDKTGQKGIVHNSAGKVRNIGMSLVKTEWIGFLDDDDTLLPTYTSKLLEEVRLNPIADVIIFRMLEAAKFLITPSLENSKLVVGNVGISFCLKTKLVPGFNFEQSEVEDFTLINKLNNSNIKMIISPYITYLVNSTSSTSNLIHTTGPRITIN